MRVVTCAEEELADATELARASQNAPALRACVEPLGLRADRPSAGRIRQIGRRLAVDKEAVGRIGRRLAVDRMAVGRIRLRLAG